jgi:hypothetical protein
VQPCLPEFPCRFNEKPSEQGRIYDKNPAKFKKILLSSILYDEIRVD